MLLIFTTGGRRDHTCVPFTPFFRLRDARLSARQDARGYRYLRLRAHPTRMRATTHSLACPLAACAGAPLSTCLHVCRERVFFRLRDPSSISWSAPCGYRYPHLQGQLERVRAAPPAPHRAHAIDPRTRLSMLFYAAVLADRSLPRALFSLCLAPASDLWRSEHLLFELRTMALRFWAAGGRVCCRLLLLVSEWCLPGWSKSAPFAL